MRKLIFMLAAVWMAAVCLPSRAEEAKKEKENVTFLVSMTCENCQKRIESNLAYEKGVTDLKVDLPAKLVTITYRTDKTSPEKLRAAIRKLGYTAAPFHPKKNKAQPGK